METYAGTLEWVNQRLHAIRAELESRNAELERHARRITDGLVTPLTEVVEAGRDLKGQLEGGLGREAGRSLHRVVEAAGRMSAVVEELLALPARVRPTVGCGPVDLTACAQDAVVALRDAAAGDAGPAPEITLDPLPAVSGDRAMLAELFRNLLDGALRLAVDPARPRVHVGVEERGGRPLFFVRGNGGGTGIDAAVSVLSSGGRTDGGGEGGLARCRQVVVRHDSTLWVESHPKRGTGFVFTLEAVLGRERPAPPVSAATIPAAGIPPGRNESPARLDRRDAPPPRRPGPGECR